MMLIEFAAARRLQDHAVLVGLLLIVGLIRAAMGAAAAVAADPDSPTEFVAVGHTKVIPVKDKNFSVVWPEETGNVQDAVSDPEILSVIRMEKLNGVAHFFVTGKRIGTVSLTCSYKKTGDQEQEAQEQGYVVYTIHVTQDVDRINKILKSYDTPDDTQLTARAYGTGERVVIEGVARSRAQLSAILRQLPNKDLATEHIVVGKVKYKCQCYYCTHGIGRTHAP